jgi:hypothetical protein
MAALTGQQRKGRGIMWKSAVVLTVVSVAAFGQAGGKLALTNVRSTYGILGPVRPDAKLLPGDSLYLFYDIEGITFDAAGKAKYSIGMEVTDSQGKTAFKQAPATLEGINALGGNKLPAHAHIDFGLDQPPGSYTVKIHVSDLAAKSSQSLTHKVDVLPKSFGLVRARLTGDPDGVVPLPAVGVVGQTVYFSCGVVGFERDKTKGMPSVGLEMRILDDKGKPTMPQAFTGVVGQNISDKGVSIPLQFLLPLNRSGKFTIEIKATDQVSKKSATLAFPYTVVDSK